MVGRGRERECVWREGYICVETVGEVERMRDMYREPGEWGRSMMMVVGVEDDETLARA